jgi:plastocyanin
MSTRIAAVLASLAVAVALVVCATASATTKVGTLTGVVGPGFNISMNKKTVKAGTYVITVKDLSNIHNFHLTGPGVNKHTSVTAVKTYKWTVKLKKGTYRFVCDPHASIMHGVLKVT